MTLLTLFDAKRSCGIDYISVHYQRKGQRVKRVMCFSLNSDKEKSEMRLMRLNVKSEAK